VQAARQPDPALQHYIECVPSDRDLRLVQTDRWPGPKKFREITIGPESLRVSVVDGYRLLYAYQGADVPFANVKVERSAPGEYAADKAILVRMQQSMPAADKVTYRSLTLNGMEVHGVDKPTIDVGGTVGAYVMFADPRQVVVSVYLLNQGPTHRKFNDLQSYQALRDRFLDDLTRCGSSP
jgi:hypothetical protein